MLTVRQKLLAGITRQYPFLSGCLKVANLDFIKKLNGFSNGKVWVKVPGGKVKASLNELMGRTAFYMGDLDRRLTWIARKLITPGDTVVDVGANIGIMTLLFSKLTGKNGTVYSFEPHPFLYKDLTAALEKNNSFNVLPFMLALGAEQGEAILNVPQSNLGLGTLIRTSNEKCEQFKVTVSTLSEFVEAQEIKKIDFLKIDVEGFEHQVLLGAESLLKNSPPEFIMLELNNFAGKAKDQPVVELLKRFNYKIISIPKCLLRMYTDEFKKLLRTRVKPRNLTQYELRASIA